MDVQRLIDDQQELIEHQNKMIENQNLLINNLLDSERIFYVTYRIQEGFLAVCVQHPFIFCFSKSRKEGVKKIKKLIKDKIGKNPFNGFKIDEGV